MVVERSNRGQESAVLCSGGLDSVVLLAEEARTARVLPLYVSVGLAWEDDERARLIDLLSTPPFDRNVAPLAHLDLPMRDVYGPSHWAIRGTPPAYDTADEDVYLVGRNIVLLSKAAVMCAQRGIGRLVLGPLDSNPFPDATPAFFDAMARALTLGLDHELAIATPFVALHKAAVIRRGVALGVDVGRTLSCMRPRAGRHCGMCSKCRERRDAFDDAGVPDTTDYEQPSPRAHEAGR